MNAMLDKLRADVGAVVAKHEAQRGLVDLTRYADDPIGFLTEVLRCTPWSAQEAMALLVRDNGKVAISSCNGAGKDWLMARIALWWVYAVRGLVIFTSGTDRQIVNVCMREVRRAFLAVPDLPGELFQRELRVDDSSGILAFTSDSMDRLTGFHHPKLLLILSEAQGLEAEVFEAAFACATGEANRVAAIGNPTRQTGEFYNAVSSPAWRSLTVSAFEHPNVATGREEIPGGPSRSWIESMREEYGEASSIYKSRVLAQFPTEAIEAITTRANLERAFVKHETASDDSIAALHQPAIVAWDVSLRGADSNAAAVCQGTYVRELLSWHADDINKSYQQLEAISAQAANAWSTPAARRARRNRSYPNPPSVSRCSLVVDEAGMGGPAVDELKRRGFNVTGFIGAGAPFNSERYLNRRAEAYMLFKLALEKGRVALPRNERLLEEALATEWTINARDKVQIIAKDEIRRTLGHSPDLLDAVVMGLYVTLDREQRPQFGSSTWVGGYIRPTHPRYKELITDKRR